MPQEEADEKRTMRHAAYRQYCGSSANLVKVTEVLFTTDAYRRYLINTGILYVSALVFIHLVHC